MLRDLRLRGLITAEGRPLCDAFARLIPELMPDGLTMEKALARFKKGGEAANSVLDILEHWAKTGGRLYRALKGDLAESEEKRS